ncbi:hypothetical protein Q427_14310 [Halomonas sp. BC04]|nr:hypothetical protein Q427_14310 [Halomonas sp. BC04]
MGREEYAAVLHLFSDIRTSGQDKLPHLLDQVMLLLAQMADILHQFFDSIRCHCHLLWLKTHTKRLCSPILKLSRQYTAQAA